MLAARLHSAVPTARFAVAETVAFLGVLLVTLATPFEATAPLVRLPSQSISDLEAALLVGFGGWVLAVIVTRRFPQWRSPVTAPWTVLIIIMAASAVLSPVSRTNALHMCGRAIAAFCVFLLTLNGVTSRDRMQKTLAVALATAVVVSVLVVLEHMRVRPVLELLQAFRPDVSLVGPAVRAGGSLQYPTITSMYLEVIFASGLGLLLVATDSSSWLKVAAVSAALVLVAEAISLTYTRAGLLTMAASLAVVIVIRLETRGGGVLLLVGLAAVIAGLELASWSSESLWLRLTTEAQESWYRASIEAPAELTLRTGSAESVPVVVTNTGRLVWDSAGNPPFYLSYHWLTAEGDGVVTFNGVRTAFPHPIEPGKTLTINAEVRAPQQPGAYRLMWDVTQEGRLWFSTEPDGIRTLSRARISGPPTGALLQTTSLPRPTVRPGRLVLWRAAARMFLSHPWLGVGPDNFRLDYGRYADLAVSDPRIHSNNMYIEALVGGGVVGAALFAWLLWSIGGCAIAGVRERKSFMPAQLGILAAVVAIALHGFVDSFLSFTPTYVLFATTIGLACSGAAAEESPLHAHCF
jgi:hypothetical protein